MGGSKESHAFVGRLPTKKFDAVLINACISESWLGSFIAGTAPSFSIKWCANPASNWAWFIKHSWTNNHTWKLCCYPWKTNCWCVYAHALPGELPIQGIPPFMTLWRSMFEKTSRNLYKPERSVFGIEILRHTSKSFFETLAVFSMITL